MRAMNHACRLKERIKGKERRGKGEKRQEGKGRDEERRGGKGRGGKGREKGYIELRYSTFEHKYNAIEREVGNDAKDAKDTKDTNDATPTGEKREETSRRGESRTVDTGHRTQDRGHRSPLRHHRYYSCLTRSEGALLRLII